MDLEQTERFWSALERVLPSSLPYMSVTQRIETLSAATCWISETSNVSIPGQLASRMARARRISAARPKPAKYTALNQIPITASEAPSVQRVILGKMAKKASKSDIGMRRRLERKLKALDTALAKRPEGDLPDAKVVEEHAAEALAIIHNGRVLRAVEERACLIGEASVYVSRLSSKLESGKLVLSRMRDPQPPCGQAHYGRMRWQQLYNKHLLGLSKYQLHAANISIDLSARDLTLAPTTTSIKRR